MFQVGYQCYLLTWLNFRSELKKFPIIFLHICSIFAGTTVVANFFLMILWAPTTLVLSEKLPSVCLLPQSLTSWIATSSQSARNFLIEIVLNCKRLWLVVFAALGILSFPIIFVYPKLRLPDSSEMQLFASSHLFEKYDLVYKDRFYFERLFKVSNRCTSLPRFKTELNLNFDNNNKVN